MFEFTVTKKISNAGGKLHGGAVSVMFDVTTGSAVCALASENFWDAGHVSRAINCQYLRPAPLGMVLIVECEVVHLGGLLGLITATMKDKKTGNVVATCVHDKVQVTKGRL